MAKFTLGVEEEYQIIDSETRDLVAVEHNVINEGIKLLGDRVKLEMHRAVVEVTTDVCNNIQEIREDVTNLRKTIIQLAAKENYKIAAAGTHPFAQWHDQAITDHPRYAKVVEELQDAARSNLVYGLHVHVGMQDRHMGVYMMNAIRYFLPHIFALSTNSPFWESRYTGYQSFRTKVFERFPRTGIPDHFESLAEFDNYVNLLMKTNCIDNAKKIWWDVRVHPFYPTVEVRICDIPMRIDETVAITALIQAIVAKIYWLQKKNLNFRSYSRALLNENKWRAARYGLGGKLIDFGKEEEVNTKLLIYELINFVDDVIDDLGSREEIKYIYQMLEQGTGATRQLQEYERTKDYKAVVDFIINETKMGIDFSK